ncbi:MAG TPA: biopolymer transporter ExbD [Polyangiaceae bacterium]|nr:biopolymer transporter ExbD [Polyangiaceae bacterium]
MGVKLGGRGGGRSGFRDINITPLVDVMLVLLIVFMVTAPLLTTGLRIDLPEVKAAETPVKDARLLVSVTKEERILFGEEDVTDRIAEVLKENARVQKERELYIRADKDARYGVVATVVAAARNSGVESLNLLVQPELEEVTDEAAAAPDKGAPKTGSAAPGRP